MANVVNFTRKKGGLKEKAIETLQNDDNELCFYMSFSKEDFENGNMMIASNFVPGFREITAVELLLQHLIAQQMQVVEEE